MNMDKITAQVSPIQVPIKLADTPKSGPRYSVKVKSASGAELTLADPRATRVMVALMDMQAVMGGAASHWGGPSAFAELLSALHGWMFHESAQKKKSWFELFHFVNDAGHCENGLYALRANYGQADLSLESLKGFRAITSRLTGHGESHLFPEGVYLSNGPLGSAFPQSQGLCAADWMQGHSRVTIAAISDGASMEGEAREAFAAIPGFAAKGRMNPYVLIISDNNTKLSGRIDQEAYSMGPSFAALKTLGWDVLELADGHNLEKCLHSVETAIAKARSNPKVPVAIHARTIKGFGVQKTEKSLSGGHGFPLKEPGELKAFIEEIYRGAEVPTEFLRWMGELEVEAQRRAGLPKKPAPVVPSEKIQIGVANAMIKARAAGLPVVSVTSDLPGSTGVADFIKRYPEASWDVGVAEANMVSMAAGLSKQGFIPFVDTFAQFGVTKGALPLIMANLSQAPVIGVFSHTGFQDAADGASHQALSWIAMTASIPHTDIYALSCSEEAEALVSQAIDEFQRLRQAGQAPRSKIFFLGRENFPRRFAAENFNYELGQAQVLFDNATEFRQAVTLATAGSMVLEAMLAAEQLKQKNVGCCVVNISCLNHPDVDTVMTCLRKSEGKLITIDDHQVMGGLGSLLVHGLAIEGQDLHVKSLGVCDEFGQSAYSAKDLYKKHSLDAESIVRTALRMVES